MSRAMVVNTTIEGSHEQEGWHFLCSLNNGQVISLPYIDMTETYVSLDFNNGSGKPRPFRIDIASIAWCVVDDSCTAVYPQAVP